MVSEVEGKDKQRRAQERAAAAIKDELAEIARTPQCPDCDCGGSIFSHDVGCAINLWCINQAGYKLVKKD